mgnify:CR=1 FL=1
MTSTYANVAARVVGTSLPSPPPVDREMKCFVVVDCIPEAPLKLKEKLSTILMKVFSGVGTVKQLYLPEVEATSLLSGQVTPQKLTLTTVFALSNMKPLR